MATSDTFAIELGDGVELDARRLLRSRALIQGASGSGKSWAIRRICEQVGTRIPTFIIDPEGEYFTLREHVDCVLISADGGDVKPNIAAAPAIARSLLQAGASAVIDLYDLMPLDRSRFVAGFVESLMSAPRSTWRSALVVIDEAAHFCPEQATTDSVSSAAIKRLLTQGRKRGIGTILATQRLSDLAKTAAAQCQNVLVGATTLDTDVRRAADLLGLSKAKAMEALRGLDAGQWHALGPAFNFRGVEVITTGPVLTTHLDDSNRAMTVAAPPSGKIAALLGELTARSESDDDDVLTLDEAKAEISRLRSSGGATDDGALKQAEAEIERLRSVLAAMETFVDDQDDRLELVIGEISSMVRETWACQALYRDDRREGPPPASPKSELLQITDFKVNEAPPAPAPSRKRAPPRSPKGNNGKTRMLVALAQNPQGCTKNYLGLLVSIAPGGGTFSKYLGQLRAAGHVDGSSHLKITDKGLQHLGDFPPRPRGQDLVDHWLDWCGGPGSGRRRMFEAVIEAGPGGLSRAQLAKRSGITGAGGTFAKYLGQIRRALLVTRSEPIRLTPEMAKACGRKP